MGSELQKIVGRFHTTYGGANQQVDDPAELTPAAVAAFVEAYPDKQWAILESLKELGPASSGFFRNALFKTLYECFIRSVPNPDTEAALQYVVYAQYQAAPEGLPPYAVLTNDTSAHARWRKSPPIESLLVFVNHHGYRLPLVLAKSDLQQFPHPQVDLVDGFVESYLVTTAPGVQMSQDGTLLSADDRTVARLNRLSHLRCDFPDGDGFTVPLRVERHPEWNRTIVGAIPCAATQPQSYFASSGAARHLNGHNRQVPSALSNNARIELRIGDGDVVVTQAARQPMVTQRSPDTGLRWSYQGDTADLLHLPHLQSAMARVEQALRVANAASRIALIDQVDIVAAAVQIAWVSFSALDRFHITMALLQESPEKIYSIALHELSHVATGKAHLVDNPAIADYFRRVLGADPNYRPVQFRQSPVDTEKVHPYLQWLNALTQADPQANRAEFTACFTQMLLFDRKKILAALDAEPSAVAKEYLAHTIALAQHFRDGSTLPGLRNFYDQAVRDFQALRTGN